MKGCRLCLMVRTVLLSVVLGGGGGYWATQQFGPGSLSMTVTFFGALLPVLWYLRDKRR